MAFFGQKHRLTPLKKMRFFGLKKILFVIVKKGFFFFFNVIKLFFKSYFDQILIEKKNGIF